MALKETIDEFRVFLGNKESRLDKNHKAISKKIELLWGYPEFYDYIKQLTIVEKDRARNGLSHEVVIEINVLREIHEHAYPKIRKMNIHNDFFIT